ncbi:hypothetical protein SUGI_1049560 [Cryptomeria japonica]|nr:hypothetical protein SUGI_1049560 [Cryptomeria japonica]
MGRNVVLGCLSCSCFSLGTRASSSPGNGFASSSDSEGPPSKLVPLSPSETHASLSSGKGFAADAGSSQVHPSRSRISSCKLVPLRRDPALPNHAVGIDDQVISIIQLLEWEDETKVEVAVILHGFGGTGKTTLADAVVGALDIQGWNCSKVVPVQSMENIVESQLVIQEQAFIYVDNVTVRQEDLQKLLPKSCKKLIRLLLTVRDEMVADVISACVSRTHVYPIRPLPSQNTMELLCNKMGEAGMQMPHHHISQINKILKICDGVPVVLERVGAYICQSLDKDEAYRRVIEWSNDGKLLVPHKSIA